MNVPSARTERLDLYEGTWRQVKSNAGECSKCSITINRTGNALQVVANNGWSATVTPAPKRFAAELPSVQGDGVWQNSQPVQSMKIAVAYNEGELQIMLIIGDRKHPRTIAATFRK